MLTVNIADHDSFKFSSNAKRVPDIVEPSTEEWMRNFSEEPDTVNGVEESKEGKLKI
jgi:hypothetical protein